jgi:hypothetical protein
MLVKLRNIKFHKNPFSGFRVLVCGQTDRDMAEVLGIFLELFVKNVKTKEGGVWDKSK